MKSQYTDYKDVDQIQLQSDIDEIRATIGDATQEDFQHLLKLERWGRLSTISGFLIIIVINILSINSFLFWALAFISAILLGAGNVGRWANVAHPILHGAYDKVPNIPYKYTKKGFAAENRRWLDWLDWIKPDAWSFEHNIMHHYHLGEMDDPDNVEKNMVWLHKKKIPMFFKYAFVYIFAMFWKLTYYAPNTLRILENKERIKKKLDPITTYDISPFKKNGETVINFVSSHQK